MNCRKANNHLSAYIDGELPGVEQLQIREHLRQCACCAEDYEALLMTKRLVSGLKVKEPNTCLEDRILGAIAAEDETVPALGGWLVSLKVWWEILAYPQKLRLSAGFAAASVALAAIVVLSTANRATDPFGAQSGSDRSAIAKTAFPPADSRMPASAFINLHDPAENGPPNGALGSIMPVSAQDAEPLGR